MTAPRHPDWLPDDAAHCDRVMARLRGLVDDLDRIRTQGDDPADMSDAFELAALWAKQGAACAYRSIETATKGATHARR